MAKDKIRIIGKSAEKIVNTGPKQRRISPEVVAEALGAKIMTPEEAAAWQIKHGPPAL